VTRNRSWLAQLPATAAVAVTLVGFLIGPLYGWWT
jgi:hypothetical protein